MEISAEFIFIEKDLGSTKSGNYLRIQMDDNPEPIYLPREEFEIAYELATTKAVVPEKEIGIGTADDLFVSEVENIRPDFSGLMKLLVDKVGINDDNFQAGESELSVHSNSPRFLELPWEAITSKEIYVFRKTKKGKKADYQPKSNHILLVTSHAENNSGQTLKPKMDEEVLGIFKILEGLIRDELPKFLKLGSIDLLHHTTRNLLQITGWNKYNYSHFILHGLQNGNLCLEDADEYKKSEEMPIAEFIELLSVANLKFCFFSFCFSGGGLNTDGGSVAFQVVHKGISQYAIGYSYPVGDGSASKFSGHFYSYLLNGNRINPADEVDIACVYREAIKRYYQDAKHSHRYTPLLYING